MAPQKITAYKAEDGTLHESLTEAMVACNRGALRELCAHSSILRAALGDIDDMPEEYEAFVAFLITNQKKLVKLLGGVERLEEEETDYLGGRPDLYPGHHEYAAGSSLQPSDRTR